MFTLLKILALLTVLVLSLMKPKRKIIKEHLPVSKFVVDDHGDIKTGSAEPDRHKEQS
jgi:hypothetical protein